MGEAAAEQADIASAKAYYDGLGEQYDKVTRAQEYDKWVGLYKELIDLHGAAGKRLLDIGCGTGKSALGLARLGFRVTGIDFSEEMLRIALGKPGANAVTFVLADVRNLPPLGPCDVATTMGEPFSHLSSVGELQAALDGVGRALEPGGLFLFDLPTAGFCDRLATWRVIDEAEDAVILWRGAPRADAEHAVDVTVDTFIHVSGDSWRRVSRTLPNYYFSPGDVDRCLEAAGFRSEAVYGLYQGVLQNHVDQQAHRKTLVVARKTSPDAAAV